MLLFNDTLILTNSASNAIQQYGLYHKNWDATPHLIRVEWRVNERLKSLVAHDDTMHRPNIQRRNTLYNEICVSPNAKQTLPLARNMPRCLENGSAWEPKKGAASRDTASGKRTQP
jgi:hypothetical protein